MKRHDFWTVIMSLVVLGCLPGLSAAIDGDPGGFKAMPSQPSGTGAVNFQSATGISGDIRLEAQGTTGSGSPGSGGSSGTPGGPVTSTGGMSTEAPAPGGTGSSIGMPGTPGPLGPSATYPSPGTEPGSAPPPSTAPTPGVGTSPGAATAPEGAGAPGE